MSLIGKTRLGSQKVMVEKESVSNELSIGEQPVEEGFPLTDHAKKDPISLSINGYILRDKESEVNNVITAIENYQKNKTKISYEGRRIYHNLMLSSFSIDTDKKTANGYSFSASLKEIRIAKTSFVSAGKTNAGRKQTSGGIGNSGGKKYHKVKKGDTYWALGIKYGTPWPTLEKWNGYKPRRIPIGVTLRVK